MCPQKKRFSLAETFVLVEGGEKQWEGDLFSKNFWFHYWLRKTVEKIRGSLRVTSRYGSKCGSTVHSFRVLCDQVWEVLYWKKRWVVLGVFETFAGCLRKRGKALIEWKQFFLTWFAFLSLFLFLSLTLCSQNNTFQGISEMVCMDFCWTILHFSKQICEFWWLGDGCWFPVKKFCWNWMTLSDHLTLRDSSVLRLTNNSGHLAVLGDKQKG